MIKIVKGLGIVFCLLFFCGIIYFVNIDSNKNDSINKDVDNIVIEDEEDSEEIFEVSLVMVGDNLIHSSIYKDAYLGNNSYDFKKMYSLIKPIVSNYDIAYYNQETILGGKELGLSDYPRFNSPQEVGDAMVDAGFNLVSLASNHTVDIGSSGVLASRAYWDSKEDVLAVGSYSSSHDRERIRIVSKNNISYTMLNYTYGTNGMPVYSGEEYLVNVWPVDGSDPASDSKYQAYKEQVKKDIESVRDSVDLLMVAMHWGVEYTHDPNSYQKDMALFLASLGVDIIIGTHPHVIQPIEWIGDTLVIYSLGNFISAQYQNDYYNKMVGLMTSVNIKKIVNKDGSSIKIENLENDFVYTYYKNWRNFLVVPFSSIEISNYLSNYQEVYEHYKKIVKRYDNSIEVMNYGVR